MERVGFSQIEAVAFLTYPVSEIIGFNNMGNPIRQTFNWTSSSVSQTVTVPVVEGAPVVRFTYPSDGVTLSEGVGVILLA